MTTEELAKIIGVSRVTLSKVINGVGGVSPKTEEKIRKYIEEYNFEPNSKARSLVGKEEQIIGLISAYSESYSGASKNISSHFATELIHLAVNSAQKRGYKTLVCLTDVEKDVRSIERLFNSKLIRGAILLGYNTGNEDIERIGKHGYPIVLVNQERDSRYKNTVAVNMDDQVSAYFAIEKLVERGHKRILYIGCNRHRLPAMRRHEGVMSALQKHKDEIESLTEIDCDFNEEKAYNETKRIFDDKTGKKPTGIFAANDIMAIGAMNALKELGYDIPGDVSIIGFDDIPVSKYLTPGLTTMSCNFEQIAATAVNSLIDLIEGAEVVNHIELPAEYVERGTLSEPKKDN
ncbi:MAG: LacI family transcriptional regulator [Lachnospiraceae bacterium]|nr:LacI family transcriptional regulator [Lachnospiraceae bacterium]